MSTLTLWLLSLGLPDWAATAVGSTLIVGAFGVLIGVAAVIDEWFRTRRSKRRPFEWFNSDPSVLRPPANRDMRHAGMTDDELPAFLRRQAD